MDQVFIMMILMMILIKAMMICVILMMSFMTTPLLHTPLSYGSGFYRDDSDDDFCVDFGGFADDSDNNEKFESKTFKFH